MTTPRFPASIGYDPPDPYAHWKMHERKGEHPDTSSENDQVTACSICDPKIKADRQQAQLRRLMAIAWDEGFKAGNRNPGFEGGPNPYREEES